MADLGAAINLLPTPSEGGYCVLTPDDYGLHRVGINAQRQPVLMLGAITTPTERLGESIQMEYLRIKENCKCTLYEEDGAETSGRFGVIELLSDDRVHNRYFIDLIPTVLQTAGTQPTPAKVSETIWRLVELFRYRASVPSKTLQGLWGELFLIARAGSAAQLLKTWHAESDDCWDFNGGHERLEVKTTSKRDRVHHFSFEQLNPPEGVDVVVASLTVEKATAGSSARDLVTKIAAKANNPDAILELELKVAAAVGRDMSVLDELRFDETLAEASLRFYHHTSIPRLTQLVEGVNAVHFMANLTMAETLDVSQSSSGLLNLCLPKIGN